MTDTNLPIAGCGWRGHIRLSTHDATIIREIWVEDVYHARDNIVSGSVVVDLGANVGIFSLFAQHLGAKYIRAVEPVQSSVEQFRRNIESQLRKEDGDIAPSAAHFDIREVAVGGLEEWAQLVYDDPMTGQYAYTDPGFGIVSQDEKEVVPVVCLDDLLADLPFVDFLKVDIEGAEWSLFQHASLDTLSKCRFIAIEFHGSDTPYTQVRSTTFGLGALVERLSETHGVQVLGQASKGGYLYCTRHGAIPLEAAVA